MKIRRSDYLRMPWKNGSGVTHEIDRVPGGSDVYLWRLSQAPILNDSAFSLFPGFDRWLVVLDGDPIDLNDRRIGQLEPVRFSGDAYVHCHLTGGPVQDLGLIFDRAKVDAKMSLIAGAVHLTDGQIHYIFDLDSGDTTKIEAAASLTVARSLLVSVWVMDR